LPSAGIRFCRSTTGLYALQPTIPYLARSSLHRCLRRHGISRLPQVEGEASPKRKFKAYPIGYFHIDIAEDATVKRSFYESHNQLRTHLRDFVDAYNFARRLKTLKGLTPYEFICKAWTSQPERFKLNPLHKCPGLNS
jgi:hypothetical protein